MPRAGKEFLDEVVLFVIERGAAKVRDGHGAADLIAIFGGLLPVLLARVLHAVGDHVHGLFQRDPLPRGTVGTAVKNVLFALFDQ